VERGAGQKNKRTKTILQSRSPAEDRRSHLLGDGRATRLLSVDFDVLRLGGAGGTWVRDPGGEGIDRRLLFVLSAGAGAVGGVCAQEVKQLSREQCMQAKGPARLNLTEPLSILKVETPQLAEN